jgi:hypothetical protein
MMKQLQYCYLIFKWYVIVFRIRQIRNVFIWYRCCYQGVEMKLTSLIKQCNASSRESFRSAFSTKMNAFRKVVDKPTVS